VNKATPRRLRHASGYLQLGMSPDAAAELDAIAFEDRLSTPVLAVRIELHMAAKQWETVVGIGRELARAKPEEEQAWISWAYALRELNRVEEARTVLLEAETLHGTTSAVLHYNLACYYCLLGDLETARKRLAKACQMEADFEKAAREDPDLKQLFAK
jgi:Flp pilus assembly protein TadD